MTIINIERYDVVNPASAEDAASLGYGPGNVGELLVQRDGEYIATAARLSDATRIIADDSGNPTSMIQPRWVGHEARFVFNLTA